MPPKGFKKKERKKKKIGKDGVFLCIRVMEISFSVIFSKEYMLWKGFYSNFSTKKVSDLP